MSKVRYMQKVDQILSAPWLVTVDANDTVLEDHSLVIESGIIRDIVPTADVRERYSGPELALPDHILCPGLINAHTHMSMNLLRGYADDLPLKEWLEGYIWPAEGQWVDEQFVADGSRLAMAESLLGGTTCFNDMYFFPDITARLASAAGMRASIGLIVIDFPTVWGSGPDEYLKKAIAVGDEFRHDPLISVTLAPHAPYSVSREPLEKISTLSAELDIPVHIHVQETAGEVQDFISQHGVRPLQRLAEIGLVNPSLIAVHMTQLEDSEIAMLANQGVHVVHCPESNLKLASGACPVNALLRAGVNVALGTDGTASNNDLDMFGEMRTAALLGKHVAGDASAVNAFQALRMATINGARALGLADVTGSLERGKAADIIAVDTARVDMAPVYEPVSHVVYAASRHCVQHVWVAGKQLVKDAQLTTLDADALTETAQQWQQKIGKPATPARNN